MTAALPASAVKQTTLVEKFAHKFSVDAAQLMTTLKATAFKVKEGVVTNEQMTALLIVADQYGLNPFTKEIFAFPDKHNGIVPVVSVDGWSRIINENGALDGIDFRYSEKMVTMPGAKPCPEWCEVIIKRKDRASPIVVREYLDEVFRTISYANPWQTHTKRFLRHKTLIQGARIAFGFAGIYDEDEAERIAEAGAIEGTVTNKTVEPVPPLLKDSTPPATSTGTAQDTGAGGAAAAGDDKPLTDGERAHVKAKLAAANLTEVDLKAKFGVDLAGLTTSQFKAVKAWIANPSA